MTVETAKQELIRRYTYLYENACFILSRKVQVSYQSGADWQN